MAVGLKDAEELSMKCHVCGGLLTPTVSDLPFRLGPTKIVVVKRLPVLECDSCVELSIEDHVMEKVESLLERVGEDAELAVVAYAGGAAV